MAAGWPFLRRSVTYLIFMTVLIRQIANISFNNVNNLPDISLNHFEVARRVAKVDINSVRLSPRVSTTLPKKKFVTPRFKLQSGIRLLHATLAASLLVLSNDVSLNPGPTAAETAEPVSQKGKLKCASCNRTTRRNQAAILCGSCTLCFHAKCLGLSRNDINRLKTSTEQWICLACSLPTFNDSFESPSSSLDVLDSSNRPFSHL